MNLWKTSTVRIAHYSFPNPSEIITAAKYLHEIYEIHQKTEIYVYIIGQQITRTTNTLEVKRIRLRNSFPSSKATENLNKWLSCFNKKKRITFFCTTWQISMDDWVFQTIETLMVYLFSFTIAQLIKGPRATQSRLLNYLLQECNWRNYEVQSMVICRTNKGWP